LKLRDKPSLLGLPVEGPSLRLQTVILFGRGVSTPNLQVVTIAHAHANLLCIVPIFEYTEVVVSSLSTKFKMADVRNDKSNHQQH